MIRSLALALCFCLSSALASDFAGVKHVPNFDKVNQHIYRSGQPSQAGLGELGAFGIRRVIDLRERGNAEKAEGEALSKLGIQYLNIPFPPFSAPSQEQVGSVLALLMDSEPGTILVHCRRGKDRTGTVIACYRVQHDGWTNKRALQEAKAHGMSSLERGMRSFVLHFTAVANGTALAPAAQ